MCNKLLKKVSCILLLATSSFSVLQADVLSTESQASEVDVVNAVWQEHEARIFYTSFSVYYSCSSIEDSVERILEDLGAKDVKARAGVCGIDDVERSIPIRVKFKALSSDSALEGATLNASYSEVDFQEKYRRRASRNSASSCDLIRAVSKSVTEVFDLETLQTQPICNSGYSSSNDVKWKVKVLKPVG